MKKGIPFRSLLAAGIILFVLVADQLIKFWVKTNMSLYERIEVTDWFQLCFTENEGMAFGMDFIGTMFLTVFRVIAVAVFAVILVRIIRRRYPVGLIVCLSFIVAGAAGNIIDNSIYGLIFTQSVPGSTPAELVPWGSGYGSFLSGHVVDMFYFPLFVWPDWLPFLGGKVFFNAIFNFADAAISCGAVALLLCYYRYLSGEGSPRAPQR